MIRTRDWDNQKLKFLNVVLLVTSQSICGSKLITPEDCSVSGIKHVGICQNINK